MAKARPHAVQTRTSSRGGHPQRKRCGGNRQVFEDDKDQERSILLAQAIERWHKVPDLPLRINSTLNNFFGVVRGVPSSR